MNNQINTLRDQNVRVEAINSTIPAPERKRILADLQLGHPKTKLLYVTPEFCAMDYFRRILRQVHANGQLCRIAIDEAHCISEWGHDFRPSFQGLRIFKEEFPEVPMICCTATATETVRLDVCRVLGLDPDPEKKQISMFQMTTLRPNLHYEVRFKNDEIDHYEDFLRWYRGVLARRGKPERAAVLKESGERLKNVSGIIYTLFRKDCEALATQLQRDGIGAKAYHAGLSNADKDEALDGWVSNREGFDVIVATTAFGMGIDKEDVRFVVHWQIPKSFEGFYQEAGRAGRDGKASACILYYSREDKQRTVNSLKADYGRYTNSVARGAAEAAEHVNVRAASFKALVDYCEEVGMCRHHLICKYFGEKENKKEVVPHCDYACDWHKDPEKVKRLKDKNLVDEDVAATQGGAYPAHEDD
jgi:bloom syndrome protein